MRRVLTAVCAALLLYLVLLGNRFPAAWLARHYAERLPFQLHDVHGSIWSGTARLSYAGVQFEAVHWQLAFWPLLFGEQHIRLQVNDPGLRLQAWLQHSKEHSELVIDELWLDIARLNRLHVLPAGLELGGELQADESLHVVLVPGSFSDAAGQLRWSPAYLLAPQSYRHDGFIAELKADDGHLLLLVSDRGGEFSLEAIGWLDVPGNWQYRLSMQAREHASEAVRQAIRQLGRPDAEGRFSLQGSGRL
jgi:hypothetical protein